MTAPEILVTIAGVLFIAGYIGTLYLIAHVGTKEESWEDNFKSTRKK